MVHVLIVGKTLMRNGFCIGGMDVASGKSYRLMPSTGYAWPSDTPMHLGQIWQMHLMPAFSGEVPHLEDHMVRSQQLVSQHPNPAELIRKHSIHCSGGVFSTFKGQLDDAREKLFYLPAKQTLDFSTCFWEVPHSLEFTEDDRYNKIRCQMGVFSIPYVGAQRIPPTMKLPPKTLVRLSLARPFDQNGQTEPRCYVQLSGWF